LLEATFKSLVNQYTEDPKLVEDLWLEVIENYSDRNRHYHNLDHLTQLLQQLLPFKTKVENWDAILFATYYHDIIYDVLRNNNEENSAAYASERLTILKVPAQQIELCSQHILTTKSHSSSDSSDTNLFTDADLSILGSNWETYDHYCQKIRKEYAIYPDLLYKPGRKKVLQHFLAVSRIFKTEPFYSQFEERARQNIAKELRQLV
jgi:predicted metal-dependent HD superfamily phosphohydrolase